MKAKSLLYKSKDDGDWWWQTKKSGRIIGGSTEGYKRKSACIKNYDTLVDRKRIPLFDEDGNIV
jgi:uncharacterized protein YegP (UPF0339 family)